MMIHSIIEKTKKEESMARPKLIVELEEVALE